MTTPQSGNDASEKIGIAAEVPKLRRPSGLHREAVALHAAAASGDPGRAAIAGRTAAKGQAAGDRARRYGLGRQPRVHPVAAGSPVVLGSDPTAEKPGAPVQSD